MTQEEKKYPKGTIVHVVYESKTHRDCTNMVLACDATGRELYDTIDDGINRLESQHGGQFSITSLSIYQPTV